MFINFTPDFLEKSTKTKRNQKNLLWIMFSISLLLGIRLFFEEILPFSIISSTKWITEINYIIYIILPIAWIVTIIYKFYSPEKALIRKKLSQSILQNSPQKTLYCRKEGGFSEEESKLFQNSNTEIITSFLNKFGKIYPYYICEYKEYIVGIYYYIISNGKSSTTHYFSVLQSKSKKLKSNFSISKEGFFDKFKHDIEIGEEGFDKYLKITSNDAEETNIKNDIERIGRQKILNYIQEKGILIKSEKQTLYWVKGILFKQVPRISYSKNNYIIMPHGINLKDEIIQKNIQKFENFIKAQII